MAKKQTKTQRINALVASNPELSVKEIAKRLNVTPNLVHQVKWKTKKNSEFVDKVFAKWKETRKPSNIVEASRMSSADLAQVLAKPKLRLASAESDPVNHPPHYKTGGIETIDFIEAKDLNYRLGNVIKYVARAEKKGNPIEDLKKARWYLDREIAIRERA